MSNLLDDTFAFFAKGLPTPQKGYYYVWLMDATLTGTQESNLHAFIATASAVKPNYVPGSVIAGGPLSPSTIKFDAAFQFQLAGTKSSASIPVTLTQTPPPIGKTGVSYDMNIVLPWTTVDCVPNVDATTSNVVYGSQGNQFVTLVMKASSKQEVIPPP
jgi:hypothetical protein